MKKAIILLVEDNPADQNLIRRSLQSAKIEVELYITTDGQEAIDFLFHQKQYIDPLSSPQPDLILLDINLPKLDGKQVLKTIKNVQNLSMIPVTILTTSSYEKDVIESYQLGVNAYITKPVRSDDLFNLVQELESFWFQLTVLPSHLNR